MNEESVMERQAIQSIIMKNVRENLEELDENIDPNKSIADYGANSLDIVEIVTASLRELSIKIPRTKLVNVESINQLTDILYEAKNS